MCNVFQENQPLQCAFLIDVNAENLLSEIKPLELSNAIRLCVLRILTYFNDQIGKEASNLRWGYKFYNSRVITHVYERHEFKESKVEYFEEFEQEICKRLDESFNKEINFQSSLNVQDGESMQESSGKKPSPAKCLSCALTDLVHDFEWERPEITSPFKRSRRYSQTEDVNNNCCSNFVFLFTWCPCSKNLMASFCNRSIKSCDNFRNVVLPTALYQKFRGNCKISLLWVDTGLWWWGRNQNPLEDWSCRLLIKEFVKSVGGCLIPLSALVNLESFSTRGATDISRKAQSSDGANDLNFSHGVASCGILLPFASVMNHFLYQCDILLADLELKTSSSVIGDDSWTGLLCTAGNSEVVHCTVKLNPIFSHMSVTAQQQASNGQCSSERQAGVFWIQGVVQRQEFCPSWLHPTKSFSCVGFATSGPSFSSWFQELIAALNKKNLLLVIDFPDPSNGLPLTGVMQPLTSISGVLSVANPDSMLRVEKLLLWHGKRANPIGDADNKSNSNPEKELAKQPSQDTREDNEKKKMGDVRASSIFSSSDLNPLHARRNSAASMSLLEELTSVSLQDQADECEDESKLVQQLREVYRKKQNSISSGRRKQAMEQQSNKEVKTPELRSQKPNSRNKMASSKERSKKQKMVKSSKSSPSHTNNEVQGDEQTKDTESGSNKEADKEEKMVEFQDKNDLIQYLKEQYCSVIAQNLEVAAPKIAHQLVKTSLHFLKSHFPEDVQPETKIFVKENLLVSHPNLREKYENQEGDEVKQAKLNEYYLQVLLRMELAVVLQYDLAEDQLIDEVTVLLRSISFLKDPGFLSVYLREELLRRYGKLIPKFVCGVYEGLMQDPPDELLSPSERNDMEESPVKSAKPPSITTLDSQEPRSESNRIFTRHRSVGDLGKRREIVVPGKVKHKGSQKQVKPTSKKAKKESPKTPVKKVRRNLFTDESGGESVKDQLFQASREEVKQQANRRHSVAGPLKTVQETPARKQIANALWRRQHRARKRASTMTEVEVVQESPLKQLREDECLPRRSPRRHKGSVVFQRSHSFYGRSASSIPITRTKSFTATSVRDSPMNKPEVDDDTVQQNDRTSSRSPVKSPTTEGEIISPLRFSPRLRKRFSLHSLLKKTTDNSVSDSASRGKGKTKPKTPESKGPQELRSSPRLLKKRSFSCIGFTTTAPLQRNQKSETLEKLKNSSSSEVNDSQKTPQKRRDGTPSSPESRTVSKLNTIPIMQPSTPENAISRDDIENLITPVKQLANSPVFSSPTLGENSESQSPKKTSARLRKKPLKRYKENGGEETTVVQDILENSPSLSRSLRKRTSFNNDNSLRSSNKSVTAKGDVSSLRMSPISVSCEQSLLRGNCNVTQSGTRRLSSSPQKVTCPSRKHESQVLTEEPALAEKSPSDVVTPSRRVLTRNELNSLTEKTISSKSALASKSCDVIASRKNKRGEAEPEKQQSEQRRRTSSTSIRSPVRQNAEKSCHLDVLQLSDSPTKPCTVNPSPLRILSGRSPNESKAHASNILAFSTPPMKRRRGSRSLSSPSDRKRLSPLNQILKQRKPKPECFSKSPTEKCISSSPESVQSGLSLPAFTFPDRKVAKNTKRKRSPNQSPSQAKRRRISNPNNSRNISNSSDEFSDWLDETEVDENSCFVQAQDILCQDHKSAEKNSSPMSPLSEKRRIDKSVVFGGKNFKKPQSKRVSFSDKGRRRSSDAFDGDPDDDVFQSLVSVSVPHRRTKIPRTPVSLNSIKQLQESPILYGAPKSIFNSSPSKFRISPSSLTKKWTQFSPDAESRERNSRLKLRKQSSKTSPEIIETQTDVLLSDQDKTKLDGEEMQTRAKRKSSCSLKRKKRLQLAN